MIERMETRQVCSLNAFARDYVRNRNQDKVSKTKAESGWGLERVATEIKMVSPRINATLIRPKSPANASQE
ncbi:hypothetical protein EVAR_5281_1 [Eumeta japonica]|uniref:Uncharacterized protein n=1 Tax=Eumeta variegata TaxID=151549 RepID=A0A4C1TNM8_EUMVA|nr:hypothetical protein EVAR_5281_1 [Eumeta japonica]